MNFLSWSKFILLGIVTTLCLGCAHYQPRTHKDLVNYGVRLAQKGYWHEAAVHWRMVLETDPQNIAALNNLAIAAEVEGYPEKAEKILLQAQNLRTDSDVIRRNLAALTQREIDESSRPEKDSDYETRERKESRYDSSNH